MSMADSADPIVSGKSATANCRSPKTMNTSKRSNMRGKTWGWPARIGALALVTSIGLFAALAPATVAAASPSLESTGSSFAGVAIQEWVGQAATLYGLNINWQVSSSVIGLDNFAQNEIDFGASDIPYSSGQASSTPNQPYQYMPDVAGALAFMYNLDGAETGTKITNLVLDPQVIDDIFSGAITTWNAAPIAQLNPQLAGNLPDTKILAVYRVDASGENYLLSDYLLHMDTSNFEAFQTAMGLGSGVGEPSASWPTIVPGTDPPGYPGWNNNDMVGQNGSDNAANYVAASASNGAIAYVETAYADEHGDPVASLINQSGNAVQPTSVNDATALEKAVLYSDLTQNLTGVYTNPLPNAYPLSSYSYLVTPCSPSLAAKQRTKCSGPGGTSPYASDRGQALGQFVTFLACAGQQKMALLGYSPLPPNLVQEDFDAVGRLNGGHEPPPVSPSDCQNPYVDGQTPLPGEPKVDGGAPPPGGGQGVGAGGTGTTGTGRGGTTGTGGTGTTGTGGGGRTGTGGGGTTGGGGSGTTGTGGGGATGKAGKGSAGGGSAPTAAGGAAKYLAKWKTNGGGVPGQSSFLRAANLRAAASSALGFGSPIVRILAWCVVLAVAIYLPAVALGRRRRKTGRRWPWSRGKNPRPAANLTNGGGGSPLATSGTRSTGDGA
jgi:phosphate transport system substrate-binding protein